LAFIVETFNSQKFLTFSKKYLVEGSYKQHFNSAGSVCVQSALLSFLWQKVTGVPLIMPHLTLTHRV